MIDLIVGIAVLIASIAGAFFAGKRQQTHEYEVDEHNEYIATRARIEAATNTSLDDADVDDSLRRHAKR